MPVDLINNGYVDNNDKELLGSHIYEIGKLKQLKCHKGKLSVDHDPCKECRKQLGENYLGILQISQSHSAVHVGEHKEDNSVYRNLKNVTLEPEISQRLNYAVLEMEIPMETEDCDLQCNTSHAEHQVDKSLGALQHLVFSVMFVVSDHLDFLSLSCVFFISLAGK